MNSLPAPVISVVILNYNGAQWIERCLESLKAQTLFDCIEVIVADNASSDGSDRLASEIIQDWPNARLLQHGANLGYCEGNNRAAGAARGRYLLFLNNDTWLEPLCLETLAAEVQRVAAQAATPLVLDYSDDSFQSLGAAGFDLFGLVSTRLPFTETREILMPEGCSCLIERELFEKLGGFDPVFFMYADELDLSWRVWLAGHKAVAIPSARLHHRGAVHVNPEGGSQVVEFRTSDTKRFYANRNSLLVLLKNCQHVLLLLVPLQVGFLFVEALVAMLLVGRWSFVRRVYWDALTDCWRLRGHVLAERKRIRQFRRRSDWWMLRFLRWRLNRWDELRRMMRFGKPHVAPH